MIGNMLPSEACAVLGTIDPDAIAAGTVVSDYVDLGKFERVMVVIMAGTLGTSATVDASILQATDSAGTGAKALSPAKAITQLTEAGTDSDKQVIINVQADELDISNDFDHIAVSVDIGTATSDFAAVIFGFNPRSMPASDNDLASVAEIVS